MIGKKLNLNVYHRICPTEPMNSCLHYAKQSFSYLDLYSSAVKIHR